MYPEILQESNSTLVVALSDTEVGKVLLPPKYVWVDAETQEPIDFPDSNWSPSYQKECDYLQFVNKINDAFPKFIRSDFWETPEGKRFDMLVMERLYPLPYNHFGIAERREMFAELERKLLELHEYDFIHGDIMRPTNYYTRSNYEWMFGNIIQTENGLRLTDLGFSMRYEDAEHKRSYIARMFEEKNEIQYFKEYYFSLKKSRKKQAVKTADITKD